MKSSNFEHKKIFFGQNYFIKIWNKSYRKYILFSIQKKKKRIVLERGKKLISFFLMIEFTTFAFVII